MSLPGNINNRTVLIGTACHMVLLVVIYALATCHCTTLPTYVTCTHITTHSCNVFASPSVSMILAAIRVCAGPKGILLIVKNYTGDRYSSILLLLHIIDYEHFLFLLLLNLFCMVCI